MATFENLPILSELAAKPRSDRQNKQLAKAASRVVGAPLTHAQWLQHLRDGDLEQLDAAHALPPKHPAHLDWDDDYAAAEFARDVAATTRRATELALVGALGLDKALGCGIGDLRIGDAMLDIDPDRAGGIETLCDRLSADVPTWLTRITGANASLGRTDGDTGQIRVYLSRPIGPDVTTQQQMVDAAVAAAGLDPSAVTIHTDEWSKPERFDTPGPFCASKVAVALARLDGRLPDGWTTYNMLESPGNGWPVAIDVERGVGVTANLNELHLELYDEQLTVEVAAGAPFGGLAGPDSREAVIVGTYDYGDLAGVTIGRLTDALCERAHALAG